MGSKTYFPAFKDEGDVIARFGEAQLIRFLDGKMELQGGSNHDRIAAREWMSMFWHEAVVQERYQKAPPAATGAPRRNAM